MQKVKIYSWKQFLTWKKTMLDDYDTARQQTTGKPVKTRHGNVAEAVVRRWLSQFLPKKYGVTSGYIISQRPPDQDTLFYHFDVIIFDKLESPVLWLESSPDLTDEGRSRAIPAEFVKSVFEVKSSLNSGTATEAIGKLSQLSPLLSGEDDDSERYKRYLPNKFFSSVIFFELKLENSQSKAALSNLIPDPMFRGYFGGLVLRGEGVPAENTGRLQLLKSHQKLESTISPNGDSLLSGVAMSDFKAVGEDMYIGSMLSWSQIEFAKFAFDVIALLNGTYDITRISSFHGLPLADAR